MAKYQVSIICLLFIFYLCAFPVEMLRSVKEGLMLWYNSVLPSVLPFLITSNVLIEIGAVSKLGRMLEPVMRPVFNVPGCGAFACVMGGVSGYPVGAKITADFREKGIITKDEAQRLISFCNNPGPLFMLGAVGTVILDSVAAGYYIMATNYLSSIVVGLIFRFYKTEDVSGVGKGFRYVRSSEQPALGAALGNSVRRSIEVILQVGGFILLFSAFIEVLKISHFIDIAVNVISPVLMYMGFDKSLAAPMAGGIFEMTNGVKLAGASTAPFMQKVILSGMLVSFGGLAIYAQTVSFISKTDISPRICFFAKIVQAIFQLLIMMALLPVFNFFMKI